MKPKESKPGAKDGLLEYLEDIIGSNTNNERIDEIEKEIANDQDDRFGHFSKLKNTEAEVKIMKNKC